VGRIAGVLMEVLGGAQEEPGIAQEAEFVIRKEGSEIILYSADGSKVLGRFPFGGGKQFGSEETAREAAAKRERQIQFFKHKHGMLSDVEMRMHHSDAWHRCWEKVKASYPSDSAAAICTWSVGRPPNPPDVYAQEGTGRIRLTVEEAEEMDEGLAAEMRQRGIAALWIDPQTWEVEEVHKEEREEGMDEKQLAELKDKLRKELEAEMAEKNKNVVALRAEVRKEVEAELAEKAKARTALAEFAAKICGGEHALAAKPDEVVAFLEGIPEAAREQAKKLLESKVVDLGEKGSSRDGKGGKKALPEEYAQGLDAGTLKLADLANPILELGELGQYDLSKWQGK